ncbi:hypothetical protein RCL1_000356 [Eukaryota sp. TZLM3-RCL]
MSISDLAKQYALTQSTLTAKYRSLNSCLSTSLYNTVLAAPRVYTFDTSLPTPTHVLTSLPLSATTLSNLSSVQQRCKHLSECSRLLSELPSLTKQIDSVISTFSSLPSLDTLQNSLLLFQQLSHTSEFISSDKSIRSSLSRFAKSLHSTAHSFLKELLVTKVQDQDMLSTLLQIIEAAHSVDPSLLSSEDILVTFERLSRDGSSSSN